MTGGSMAEGYESLEDIPKMRSQKRRLDSIMVDTYDEWEQDAAMETYVGDCLHCPFEARMRGGRKRRKEKVRVLRIICNEGREIKCDALVRGARVRIPLLGIEPLSGSDIGTRHVLADYRAYLEDGW